MEPWLWSAAGRSAVPSNPRREFRLPSKLDVADGGAFGLYRLACACGWMSRPMRPAEEPEQWQGKARGHVCATDLDPPESDRH